MRKIKFWQLLFFGLFFLLGSCQEDTTQEIVPPKNLKLLSLGDSYTIGESVCTSCRFPVQLKDSIAKQLHSEDAISVQVIATTGWTTTQLKNAVASANLTNQFDLVTLLIGVNNQYQNKPFTLYEQEFPELLQTAINLANGDVKKVVVVSIPDYAFTPFGQNRPNPALISQQIDAYNNFAQQTATNRGVAFVNITDITRLGLQQPNLVASDGLHPSSLAYTKFVERILPKVTYLWE